MATPAPESDYEIEAKELLAEIGKHPERAVELVADALESNYDAGCTESHCADLHVDEVNYPDTEEIAQIVQAVETLHRMHDPKFPARLCPTCTDLMAITDRLDVTG
jgi:hypothetical protein